MRWVLRLVRTGVDGQSLSVDVMEFIRPDGLVDIAKLGLTLADGKQLLVQVQQEVVAAQAENHAMLRPDCRSCGGRCHVKDWRPHRIATLFGEVRVRLPRFLCVGCRRTETGVSWPSHCRSTPELDQLQARAAHKRWRNRLRPRAGGDAAGLPDTDECLELLLIEHASTLLVPAPGLATHSCRYTPTLRKSGKNSLPTAVKAILLHP
jgi:hypothetical protein